MGLRANGYMLLHIKSQKYTTIISNILRHLMHWHYGCGSQNIVFYVYSIAVLYGMIHYPDVIMSTIASQITSLTIVYSTVYSDADKKKYQSSASLAFVRGIHRRRRIPRTNGQYAENASIWWRHHELWWCSMWRLYWQTPVCNDYVYQHHSVASHYSQ